MDKVLVQAVRARAKLRCEYCRVPQIESELPFSIDHVIARQHGGPTTFENLALSCPFCNSHKGPNIAGIDPLTRQLTELFNPRKEPWDVHFRWDGVLIDSITAIGRVTVLVLAMNDGRQLALRQSLALSGWFLEEHH